MKCLAIRLKQIMKEIISKTPSAFVGGRQIFDNAMVGYECMHRLRSSNSCPSRYMGFKLDMSKAYDRVEWSFLDAIMEKMGFSRAWIKRVLNCVNSASFSVLINGHSGLLFTAEKGLRQGCPLSPFLFIICAEGLSSLISSTVDLREIEGLKVARDSLVISHLFFADDSLLFAKANVDVASVWKHNLHLYEKASGQVINVQKSLLCVSPNVPDDVVNQIKSILGVEVIEEHAKYLGLPSSISHNKKDIFSPICDRISSVVAA